ncbi:phage/plasmid primase, P4 family [Leptotrichia hofstadii]|uniref:Phage/plasmid primase, P4 family domain protein n=1 Tax=Leptotrichia hofstadii F0254 TaxID=634994 RepID=C9MX29_9FUSO|nr:DNA primase family protein [Leptotrichia hofstadii]EEX75045.1 phage/plasmid primase, P4 family domain protein [Leptotrichia hofstadii F0254]
MKFEECYRGFIWADMEKFYNQEKKRPDKRIKTYTGKDRNGNVKEFVRMEPYRQKKKLKTFAQAKNMPQNYNSIAGVLAPNIILIDVDTKEEGEKLIEILTDLGIDCPMIESDKGYHFLFKDIYGYKKSDTKFYTPIGIEIDIKLGNKGGLEFLTVAGEERKIINDTSEIPDLPIFLYSKGKFEQIGEIKETDGYSQRNDFMNAHNYHLQKLGYTFDEALEICAIVDGYIFYEPLPESEFKRTVRDLGLELENGVYSDRIPLENVTAEMFFNEKGRFMHHLFGEYLARLYNPVKIDEVLYIYDRKEGIYTTDTAVLKKAMFDLIPSLKINNKRETMDTFNTLAREGKVNYRYRAVANGILDTKEFKLLDFTPDIVCTSKIPTNYNPGASTEKADKIIGSFVRDDPFKKNLICEMLGYGLYEDKNLIGKFFIIVGDKENGKSVFLRYTANTFGDFNIMSLDLKDLGSRFATTLLRDKIFNLGDDISGNYIDETDVLKKVVTGEKMVVEEKGKQGRSESYNIALIFTANKTPRVKDPTGAVLRRAMLVIFDNDFSVGSPARDNKILQKIKNEEEREGLLKLAVEGLKRLSERGYFEENEETIKNLIDFDFDNNPIKEFDYEMRTLKTDGWYIGKTADEVHSSYIFWCSQNDIRPLRKRNFTKEFKALHKTELKRKRIDGERIFVFE